MTANQRDERLSGRRRSEDARDPDIRSEYERDVDRVFYNYYFRRLAEVTQVSSAHDKALRHNRMTHSLKVAQVGRRLAQYLLHDPVNKERIMTNGGIDPDVVAAAGLLHDVGHPPFGHIGELQLNRLAKAHKLKDGYEGNAQTLRIILSLSAHQHGHEGLVYGLDLTRAVVAACVKYPHSSEETTTGKWGYYKPEAETFSRFVAPLLPAPGTPTLEARIMDWADDITYAVHDLQDFYMDGIIPLHNLRHNQVSGNRYEPVQQREFNEFWQYVTEKLRQSSGSSSHEALVDFEKYANKFPESHFRQTREETAKISALASQIITDASKATAVTEDGRLFINPSMKAVINVLKQVTWYYVIDHPDLVSTQLGQRAKVNQVFNKLYKRVEYCFRQKENRENGGELTSNEQWIRKRRLPTSLREFTEQLLAANHNSGAYGTRQECYARGVLDFIASMTEVEFERMVQRLCPVENYEQVDDGDLYRGDEGALTTL